MCAKARGETIEPRGRERNEQQGDLERVFLLVPDQQCERFLCLSPKTWRKSFSQLPLKRRFTARASRSSGSWALDGGQGLKQQGMLPMGSCSFFGWNYSFFKDKLSTHSWWLPTRWSTSCLYVPCCVATPVEVFGAPVGQRRSGILKQLEER